MKRKRISRISRCCYGGIVLVLLALCAYGQQQKQRSAGPPETTPGKRPNIVLVVTDELTADALEYMGTPQLQLPAIQWIAAHGRSFNRAYCAQPLCTPSRVSMFTGKRPHETGITANVGPDMQQPADVAFLGKVVRSAGYATGYVGKWHMPVSVTDKAFHGFDYIVNTRRRDYLDASIPADCAEFIQNHQHQPFFLVASFVNPHDICEWARGGELRMNPLSVPPPASECPELPDNFAIPPAEPEVIREIQRSSYKTYPVIRWDSARWRQYRWAYNQLVEKVDAYIGLILQSLRKNKLLEHTVILFTSDHGDGYAAHHWNQKQVLYEEAIRVPFIIATKGGKVTGHSDALVNVGTDLYPTICALAGAAIPNDIQGVVQWSLGSTEANVVRREQVVVETTFCDNDQPLGVTGRAFITNRYKYIVYSKGTRKEQLFDLGNDPGEQHNLVLKDEYHSVLENMRDRLRRWCERTKDDFPVLSADKTNL